MITPIIISLKTTIISTLIVSLLGVFLAKLLLKKEGKLKVIIESLIMIPLFMPPSLIGYILLILFGKRSLIGEFLYNTFDFTFIFSIYGAVLASVVTALPIMYGSAKGALLSIDENYIYSAMDLGANKFQSFYKITVPLAGKGILSGVVLSFARCFGEFGATMMIAGNIPGKTQNIPMAIYYAVERGDNKQANFFAIIVIIVSITLIYIYNKLLKEKKVKTNEENKNCRGSRKSFIT